MARPKAHAKFLLQWMNPRNPAEAEVWEDPKLRGIAVGILAVANKAMAGRNGGKVTLGRTDVAWIAGVGWRYGIKLVDQVCVVLGWTLEGTCSARAGAAAKASDSEIARASHPRSWVVTIPNFIEDQGYDARNVRSSQTPHSQTHTHSQAQVGVEKRVGNKEECPTCLGVETFRGARYCRPHGRERGRELEQGRQKSAELEAASRRYREDTEAAASASGLSIPEMQALSLRNGRSDSSPASAPRRNS